MGGLLDTMRLALKPDFASLETERPALYPPLEELIVLPTAGDVFSLTPWDVKKDVAGEKFKERLGEIFGTYGNGHIKSSYGFHLNEQGVWEIDGFGSVSFRQFLNDINGVPVPEFLSKFDYWIRERQGSFAGAQYTFVKEMRNPVNLVGLYMSLRTKFDDPFSLREQRIYLASDFYKKNFRELS